MIKVKLSCCVEEWRALALKGRNPKGRLPIDSGSNLLQGFRARKSKDESRAKDRLSPRIPNPWRSTKRGLVIENTPNYELLV